MIAQPRTHSTIFRRLGERLVSDGLIGDDQLRLALERQHQTGGYLGEVIVSMGFLKPLEIKPYLEQLTGFPFLDISEDEVDLDAARLVPESFAVSKSVLPVRFEGERIVVAMADPLNLSALDELRTMLGRPVDAVLALSSDLKDATKRVFNVKNRTRGLLDEMVMMPSVQTEEDPLDSLLAQADEAPLVRLVNSIVASAVAAGASDIHIEPHEDNLCVRYRIDGVLYDQMNVPSKLLPALTSRLKVMSGLDISERRRPQDGRFTVKDEAGDFDVRLSILPTVYGEKSCMRLLEKSNSIAKMEKIGLLPSQREMFERFVKRPHGLILVTGPTGSGKSTTMYAALQHINDPSRNINTIEDPVEYKLSRINQVQVNPKIGLTFASGLRSLVRQDPDVILVGEIRDAETAEISVQAALTGHLVLSSLHTNDAPGALVRLQNMGVEPFLISSAVVGIVGQRLLRLNCPHCLEVSTPPVDLAMAIGLNTSGSRIPTVARGKGCRRCNGRGTKGRTGAYEILAMTDGLREMVLDGASGAQLSQKAVEEGMQTMRQAALEKVISHMVPPEEIIRVFSQEE